MTTTSTLQQRIQAILDGAVADGAVAFGHRGYGGFIGLAVPGRHLALAIAKNQTSAAQPVHRRILEALDLPADLA